MPSRDQDCGVHIFSVVWHIDQRSDVKAREALVQELFNVEAVGIDASRDDRAKSRLFCRQTTYHLEHGTSKFYAQLEQVGFGLDLRPTSLTSVVLLPGKRCLVKQ